MTRIAFGFAVDCWVLFWVGTIGFLSFGALWSLVMFWSTLPSHAEWKVPVVGASVVLVSSVVSAVAAAVLIRSPNGRDQGNG